MYTYQTATGIAKSTGSQWKELELRDTLVYVIYLLYAKVYLSLTHPVLPDVVFVDMDSLRTEFSSYDGTLDELLVELADRALDTVPSIPDTRKKQAKYSDLIRAQYKIDLATRGLNLPDNYPKDQMDDLIITRPKYKTDVSNLHNYTMLSVNGYYHNTTTDSKATFIIDGAKGFRKSGVNHCGCLSFYDIGKLSKLKILSENIKPLVEGAPLKEKINFSVEGDFTNKCCVLILGGYMIFPKDGVFWQNGDNSFLVDITNMPYIERLFESKDAIDLSSLELSYRETGEDSYDIDELYSDEVLRRYFTLSQSFLLVVDTPYLTTVKHHIRHANLPGLFISYNDPVWPLFVGEGRTAEQWKVYEAGQWAVTIQDSFYRNSIISQQSKASLEIVNSNLFCEKPFTFSHGHLLEITGFDFN